MMRRLPFVVLLLVLIGCSSSDNEIMELENKIFLLEEENQELILQRDAYEELSNSLLEEIELSDGDATGTSEEHEQVFVPEIRGMRLTTSFYGSARITDDATMYDIGMHHEPSSFILKKGDIVQILDVYSDIESKEIALVNSYRYNLNGFVYLEDLEKVTVNVIKQSQWDVGTIKLGSPSYNAMIALGNDFVLTKHNEYSFDYVITYKVDGFETYVNYDSISNVVNRIYTKDPSFIINNKYSIGDDAFKVAEVLDSDYSVEDSGNYILLRDKTGYFMRLYFDESNGIVAILYLLDEIEA